MYSNYDSYTYQTSSLLDTINGLGKFINIISLIIGILSLIAMYKLYKKLGMPGWYALIPIYNIVKLFNYFELSGWLILVPGLNVGCMFYCYYKILEKFNKGKWYYICLIPFTFIVLLIVAFSKEENNTQNMQVNDSSSVPEAMQPFVSDDENNEQFKAEDIVPGPLTDKVQENKNNLNEISNVSSEEFFEKKEHNPIELPGNIVNSIKEEKPRTFIPEFEKKEHNIDPNSNQLNTNVEVPNFDVFNQNNNESIVNDGTDNNNII